MLKQFLSLLLALILFAVPIYPQDAPSSPIESKEQKIANISKDETVTTEHSITINRQIIPYVATVGTLTLDDDKGHAKATFAYVAYTKSNVEDVNDRPITFCFNGGPGSSSVWLNLGMLGPKRVNVDESGLDARQPYHLVDNPYSMIDMTDLVFIDPVSTGYSRAADGEDSKQFHGVESDNKSVVEFIRLYVTRNQRWESPKFLMGESYGGIRAVGVASELYDDHYMYFNGIFFVSAVLDFQTLKIACGNDLPYILFLPSYTAVALYHHKLSDELQRDAKKTMEEVQKFAYGEYAEALLQGDKLSESAKKSIVEKLVAYTGLSEESIDNWNLRIRPHRFMKRLMHLSHRSLGRFDSRYIGVDAYGAGDYIQYDSSFDFALKIFTPTFNQYVREELKWRSDQEYKVMGDVHPWNYDSATNQYLNVCDKLREMMSRNEKMGLFVARGLYDLAIPYNAAEYTFAHLNLTPILRKNVEMHMYDGGHMMYLNRACLEQLKQDMSSFMRTTLKRYHE